ncbi:hypothetical protein ASPWEDRAFT_45325 [Aspergillus wentii DTO 134E9]|uniref:D-xylose reductase [NAD(P)H] n=1 Tax=Aspergillus wentii DTO 134E9 TaxID=1073089 RepID=A0A1L9R8X8_ASPWE|nr:uncharacterized protein ASPWEDRAFT_45325 [Aspergillus wentii DTO 134E9]OJJ31385.1 hypothetical protein ASPWEDRAFT_45325 [Aspergillus wentii DTO 134E9]
MVGITNDFLATYAADAGIPKTASPLPRYNNRHYNIIVVGLGHRGYKTFFKNLIDSPSISITAACDVDPVKRQVVTEKHPKIPVYSSLEKLLQTHKPDFAIVAVPHRFHADCTLTLAQAGIPILKEKPASNSLAEYQQLVSLPVRMGVTLQKRFEPRFVHFRNFLPLVGEVVSVRATIAVNCMQPDDADWRVEDEVGVAEDMGSHMLDMMVWLFGKPSSLVGYKSNLTPHRPTVRDDVSQVIMQWNETNIVGHLYSSRRAHRKEESIVVAGTTGTLCLDDNTITHFDSHAKQTLQLTDSLDKTAIIRNMCEQFGDYAYGLAEYPTSLANLADTVAIVESAKASLVNRSVVDVASFSPKVPGAVPSPRKEQQLVNGHGPKPKPKATDQRFTLNTGAKMPAIGLGTRKPKKPAQVYQAVLAALKAGYRHIDTAYSYQNEHQVGQAIRDSGIPRDQIWITTKLDNRWHNRVEKAISTSLDSLGTDYVDLYLMHWPSSTSPDDPLKSIPDWNFIKTWEEMQKLPASGRVRNLGVSNFNIVNLERLSHDPSCKIVPAVNQIELHPYWPSQGLLQYCSQNNIHCTAYSPLGSGKMSDLYEEKSLLDIAEKHNKTPQQILIKWGLQRGYSVIPKSVTEERIIANFALNDWQLADEEINALLSIGKRSKISKDNWLPQRVFFSEDA